MANCVIVVVTQGSVTSWSPWADVCRPYRAWFCVAFVCVVKLVYGMAFLLALGFCVGPQLGIIVWRFLRPHLMVFVLTFNVFLYRFNCGRADGECPIAALPVEILEVLAFGFHPS